jgi:hypothetical protein
MLTSCFSSSRAEGMLSHSHYLSSGLDLSVDSESLHTMRMSVRCLKEKDQGDTTMDKI